MLGDATGTKVGSSVCCHFKIGQFYEKGSIFYNVLTLMILQKVLCDIMQDK